MNKILLKSIIVFLLVVLNSCSTNSIPVEEGSNLFKNAFVYFPTEDNCEAYVYLTDGVVFINEYGFPSISDNTKNVVIYSGFVLDQCILNDNFQTFFYRSDQEYNTKLYPPRIFFNRTIDNNGALDYDSYYGVDTNVTFSNLNINNSVIKYNIEFENGDIIAGLYRGSIVFLN